jgi:LysR family glycine cleavage system transcriptional activator
MMPMPSVACLQAFESVARHGSVTRASQELNLTQSAVSRQICQLESLLDISLFDRIRKRLEITDAGRLYLNDVRSILTGLEDATNRVMACGDTNLLNLAVLPTFATHWLMPRLNRFLQKHPDVTVNFATKLVPFDFRVEPFDASIHYGLPNWPGATSHHLLDEDTVLVCSAPFKKTQRIKRMSDLARVRLLHQTTRPEAWAEWFDKAGIKKAHPFCGPRFEQFSMMAQAVACHLGVAILPRFLVENQLAAGTIVQLFNQSIRSENSYYLVVPDAKASSSHVSAFTRWILTETKAE